MALPVFDAPVIAFFSTPVGMVVGGAAALLGAAGLADLLFGGTTAQAPPKSPAETPTEKLKAGLKEYWSDFEAFLLEKKGFLRSLEAVNQLRIILAVASFLSALTKAVASWFSGSKSN